MSDKNFTIKLTKFQGPFDLLLFFIERDELDIYDIPIAQITKDFLAYIRDAESKNIDLASEFIVVAATLMRIKAKMLLPRKQIDEEGNEIDQLENSIIKAGMPKEAKEKSLAELHKLKMMYRVNGYNTENNKSNSNNSIKSVHVRRDFIKISGSFDYLKHEAFRQLSKRRNQSFSK